MADEVEDAAPPTRPAPEFPPAIRAAGAVWILFGLLQLFAVCLGTCLCGLIFGPGELGFMRSSSMGPLFVCGTGGLCAGSGLFFTVAGFRTVRGEIRNPFICGAASTVLGACSLGAGILALGQGSAARASASAVVGSLLALAGFWVVTYRWDYQDWRESQALDAGDKKISSD